MPIWAVTCPELPPPLPLLVLPLANVTTDRVRMQQTRTRTRQEEKQREGTAPMQGPALTCPEAQVQGGQHIGRRGSAISRPGRACLSQQCDVPVRQKQPKRCWLGPWTEGSRTMRAEHMHQQPLFQLHRESGTPQAALGTLGVENQLPCAPRGVKRPSLSMRSRGQGVHSQRHGWESRSRCRGHCRGVPCRAQWRRAGDGTTSPTEALDCGSWRASGWVRGPPARGRILGGSNRRKVDGFAP